MLRSIKLTSRLLLVCGFALGCVLWLGACAQKAPEPAVEEEPEKASLILQLSEDARDELYVTNNTELAITGLAVAKAAAQEAFGENLIGGDVLWEAGGIAKILYVAQDSAAGAGAGAEADTEAPAGDDSSAGAEADDAAGQPATDVTGDAAEVAAQASGLSDALLKSAYDIQLTFEDGSQRILHSVVFNTIADASLCIEGEFAYLTYTADGIETSTLATEQAVKAAAEAAAQAAAEQQAAEEAAAQAAQNPLANSGGSYGYNYGNSGSSAPATPPPAQSSDNCLGDAVLN
jgi:hypothetical protein